MKRAIFLVIIFLAACTTTKNISPPATLIPPTLSKEEAEFAIILSLKNAPKSEQQSAGMEMANKILNYALGEGYSRRQYWFYEGRGRDAVYAGFHHRKFYMRTEIRYNDREVIFKIVDSRNLKQSGSSIHKKALQWLGYLERDVRATLGAFDRIKYEKETLNKTSQPTR